MSNWKMIKIEEKQIIAETEKAILFKIPKQDFLFWHSIKLVRESKNDDNFVTLSFTDEFVFNVFKNGTIDNNFEKESEQNYKANDFIAKFFKDDVVEKQTKVKFRNRNNIDIENEELIEIDIKDKNE